VGIGALSVGIAFTLGATTPGEFCAAYASFGITALCFVVCYCLWLIGRHRSRKRQLVWACVTALAVIVELGVALPWLYEKRQKPDVTLCFANYSHPMLVVLNPSKKTVEHASFFPVLFNLDAPYPDEPLHAAGRTFDDIPPRSTAGTYDVFSEINDSPALRPGDRVVGSVGIRCPLCESGHSFFVSVTWGGNDGWFSQIDNGTNGLAYTLMDISNPSAPHTSSAGIALKISAVPVGQRIPIRHLKELVGHKNDLDLFRCMAE
jgi:hypothetical protein